MKHRKHPGAAILLIAMLYAQPLVAKVPFQSIETFPYKIMRFSVPDTPRSVLVVNIGDVSIYARYAVGSENNAIFTCKRGKRILQIIKVKDLLNPNGWLVVSPDQSAFAITWSDGGEIGGFHTRVFERTSQDTFAERPAIVENVIRDFEARHLCKTRGDNFSAVGWLDINHLILEASVYPTSDCGPDLGYTERYVVQLSNSAIQKRVHTEN
jgi:hypothetical protein